MRTIVITLALAICGTVLLGDEAEDRAAVERTRAHLAAVAAGTEDHSSTQTLGVYMGGRLMGCVRTELIRADDGYDFRREIAFDMPPDAGALSVRTTHPARLARALRFVHGQGESRLTGETSTYRARIEAGRLLWTVKRGFGQEQTFTFDLPDALSGIEIYASRTFLGMPADQPHRFRIFDLEEGVMVVADIHRSAAPPVTVGGESASAVQLTSHNRTKGGTMQVRFATASGVIHAMRWLDAPFEFRLASSADIEAWRAGRK